MAEAVSSRLAHDLHVYARLAANRSRSDFSYRVSGILLFATSTVVVAFDFVVIAIILSRIPALEGFSLAQMGVLYGVASLGFSLGDGCVGNVDKVAIRIKEGSFDQLLVRPASPLAQLVGDQFSVRVIGRVGQAATVLAISLSRADIHWTVDRIVLLPIAVLSGAVIFGSVFVITACLSFWLVDAREVANAVTYGGNYLTQYPLTLYGQWFRRLFCFVVPLGFVSWLPVLHLLGRPDPLGLPIWLRFASPVVAAFLALLASRVWRLAIRHHRSTGS